MSTRLTEESARCGSAVIAASNSSIRLTRAATVSASKTSVRNSTSPPMPAGAPVAVQRSDNENVRSMRADWVPSGIDVTSTPFRPEPAAGSVKPVKFCHDSMTCTSGWWVRLRAGLSRSTSSSNGTSWCSKASRLRLRTWFSRSVNVGLPVRSARNTRVLTKKPTRSSSAGSRRPAIGKPTATSVFALTLASSASSAACTTMKVVALCSRARRATRSCNSAGHCTATVAPAMSATSG
ncbi:Uncharacterised protein [Mycobacteroides abscessus subsp. abscessus]|nr:Uncharacterised protein [Mycobacteroides abscessus subsp. abscessus]